MNDYTRCREDCLSCLCKEILPGWCDARCSSCEGARECPCCNRQIREQLRRGDYRPFGRKETSSRLEQVEVSISQIAYSGPWQQRPVCQDMVRFMVADLTERGQRNPIKVRIRRGSHGRTIYELVNGEVRLRAARALGWSSIRCVAKHLDNWQAAAEYLLDNLAERKMPWEEVAKAILAVEEALVTKNGRPLDSRRLGKALGRSKDWINDHKRALRVIQAHSIPKGAIPHYKLLRSLGYGVPFAIEEAILQGIIREHWTLQQVKASVRLHLSNDSPRVECRAPVGVTTASVPVSRMKLYVTAT